MPLMDLYDPKSRYKPIPPTDLYNFIELLVLHQPISQGNFFIWLI